MLANSGREGAGLTSVQSCLDIIIHTVTCT